MADTTYPQDWPLDPTTQQPYPPAGAGSPTLPASFGGPLPPGQTPSPSVNPTTVYTDLSGQGYDPAALSAAWANPTFRNDPANARVGDILGQYSVDVGGTSPVHYNQAPTAPPAAASSSSAPASSSAGNPFATPIPTSLGPTGATSGFNDSLRQTLLDELNTLKTPVSASDPNLAPALSAFNDQQTRGITDAQNQLAEEEYAANGGTGLQSGGYRTARDKILENANLNKAQFAGNLTYQASQQKMQQLQQMLSSAIAFGDTQSAQAIQAEIALIQAQLSEQGLNQGFAQGNNQLGFNYASLGAQMNRDALLAGLGL